MVRTISPTTTATTAMMAMPVVAFISNLQLYIGTRVMVTTMSAVAVRLPASVAVTRNVALRLLSAAIPVAVNVVVADEGELQVIAPPDNFAHE